MSRIRRCLCESTPTRPICLSCTPGLVLFLPLRWLLAMLMVRVRVCAGASGVATRAAVCIAFLLSCLCGGIAWNPDRGPGSDAESCVRLKRSNTDERCFSCVQAAFQL